ncbi:hypothetical protein ACFL1G_10500 [Planctomycetota bacterium]
MVRRKRTKRKKGKILFKRGGSKKSKRRSFDFKPVLKKTFAVLAVVAVPAAVVIGFFYLENHVEQTVPLSEKVGTLEMVNPPDWVNEALKEKIYGAATANGEDLRLDEDAARSVQSNLEERVLWLDAVTVQITGESIRIHALWRKPMAMVKIGLQKFYVDAELFVLDYIPVPELPIVEVKGLSSKAQIPQPGSIFQHADLAAAVEILLRFDKMDELVTADNPLLYEIASIDVSNFNGRYNTEYPHIILYAKDRTEIIWGAELGTWHRYLEAPDEEKLAKLYLHYEQYGSLMNNVKFINLRVPQEDVPRPTDRY